MCLVSRTHHFKKCFIHFIVCRDTTDIRFSLYTEACRFPRILISVYYCVRAATQRPTPVDNTRIKRQTTRTRLASGWLLFSSQSAYRRKASLAQALTSAESERELKSESKSLLCEKWQKQSGFMLLILFNVGFTEVVLTVGGERGEGAYISPLYTVITRMISALRWATM